MKKIAFMMAVVTLLTALIACSRGAEYEKLWESQSIADAQSERGTGDGAHESDRIIGVVPPDTSAEAYTGPFPSERGFRLEQVIKEGNEGYSDGKTLDELASLFTAYGMASYGQDTVITPTGAFIEDRNNNQRGFYHKLTGHTSAICPDPLCDSDTCVLQDWPEYLYIGRDHIYFSTFSGNRIYRCDTNRNHIEELMPRDVTIIDDDRETNADGVPGSGSMTTSSGFEKIFYAEGDTVYMQKLYYRENDTGVEAYGVFDCVSKEFTPIPAASEMTVLGVTGGDTVWCYRKTKGGQIEYYHADLSFTKLERATELEAIIKDTSIYVDFDSFVESYICLTIWDTSNGTDVLYNAKTHTAVDTEGWFQPWNSVYSGDYVYYTRTMTSEEINSSPQKDYYLYDQIVRFTYADGTSGSKQVKCMNTEGGRVYRRNVRTLEEELVLELTYNDVPVWIQSIQVDGRLCYITYSTHEEFNNYYNQEHSPSNLPNPDQHHCAVADLSNGTLRLVDYFGEEE